MKRSGGRGSCGNRVYPRQAYMSTALDKAGAIHDAATWLATKAGSNGLLLHFLLYWFFYATGVMFGNVSSKEECDLAVLVYRAVCDVSTPLLGPCRSFRNSVFGLFFQRGEDCESKGKRGETGVWQRA